MRAHINDDPFLSINQGKPWRERGVWPCAWVRVNNGIPPFMAAYRRRISLAAPQHFRIHVAADERYDLYLDGTWIGRGNERGAPDCWFYETYDLDCDAGNHTLVARVWSLGERAAQAQMHVAHGFLVAAEGDAHSLLSTGVAPWEAKILDGYSFLPPYTAHWRGARFCVDAEAFPWGFECGDGEGWQAVDVGEAAMGRFIDWEFYLRHLLRPATLPPLLSKRVTGGSVRFMGRVPSLETRAIPIRAAAHDGDAAVAWQALWDGTGECVVGPNETWRILIDLEQYYCAYPQVVTSGGGGSVVRVQWAESLYSLPEPWNSPKGSRDEIEGKYFVGYGDVFLPDGGNRRAFDVPWWMAGRYIELCVQTKDQPLVLHSLTAVETRYPLEMESQFDASDRRLESVLPVLIRGLQMCANETYFDCPYYEELQYAGDTRLECLVTYMMTRDDRLPRKALRLFDISRRADGLTQSRYPSRVMQIISPFALWWVMMVRDYAYWRCDTSFARALLPGVRSTLEGFERFIGVDGLLYGPEGWNTLDWVPEWDSDSGVPPDGHQGASGILNAQLIYSLAQAADLEDLIGEPVLAEHYRARAIRQAQRVLAAFYDEKRGMLADDPGHTTYSEHAQCFILLSDTLLAGLLTPDQRARMIDGLLVSPDLARTTIYFSHYLFETYREIDRIDRLFERMELWFGLVDQGLKTTIEMPEPSRSDCHGWGAHPLFHYFATVLGIRPAGPGFTEVEITPRLGSLEHAHGRLVHPAGGWIEVECTNQAGMLHGLISLPGNVHGVLRVNGEVVRLRPGKQRF